ncbi:hypothetical protein R1flu_004021 [Riccia fluitans]|uniref:Peroxidase n=1 Tax=Riccia fluitans TaxID=41844 RepID=A0ABD1YT18_9MARC
MIRSLLLRQYKEFMFCTSRYVRQTFNETLCTQLTDFNTRSCNVNSVSRFTFNNEILVSEQLTGFRTVLWISLSVTESSSFLLVRNLQTERTSCYSCPQLADIVEKEVCKILSANPNLAAGFQRLHFHDCWVNGCDGSVLIKTTPENTAEVDAFVNFMLRAIPEIDQIKAAVEAQCPNTVSCADIVALAARDATVFAHGPSWPVDLGRRDSRRSVATDADTQLPFPNFLFSELVSNFAAKGFGAREMIVLSGSHTFGRTHCNGIGPNLYNYTGIEDLTNPNLDPAFAASLKSQCPKGNRDNVVLMDSTPNFFDTQYYQKVLANQGDMISDDELIRGPDGASVLQYLTQPGSSWFAEFAAGMAKMSKLSPLLAPDGEIRKSCQFVN